MDVCASVSMKLLYLLSPQRNEVESLFITLIMPTTAIPRIYIMHEKNKQYSTEHL